MAQRRMFSHEIVCSEEFLEMPATSRELYFQLGMRADDDGFIQPQSVLRSVGATGDDLKILLTKRFLLHCEGGVVVVKHWLIHNMIRSDRYKASRFDEQKKSLFIKENKAYTDDPTQGVPLLATKWQPNGNQMAPQVRLGKGIKAVAKPTALLSSPSKAPVIEVRVTTDGEERAPKKKVDTPAFRLREKLYDLLQEETGHRPTPNIGDYKQLQKALKKLTEDDVVSMFEDVLHGKGVETVRGVFTDRAIDVYEQQNL